MVLTQTTKYKRVLSDCRKGRVYELNSVKWFLKFVFGYNVRQKTKRKTNPQRIATKALFRINNKTHSIISMYSTVILCRILCMFKNLYFFLFKKSFSKILYTLRQYLLNKCLAQLNFLLSLIKRNYFSNK